MSLRFSAALLAVAMVISGSGFAGGHGRDRLFQYSTINALLEGHFEGQMTFKRLARKGNFGLGTFNHLDGEMIAVDGMFYQIRSDGKARIVSPETQTPFAMVSHFSADHENPVPEGLDFKRLEAFLDQQIPRRNLIQAIRIDGTFRKLVVRSIKAQTIPYPSLAKATATGQVSFTHENVEGTLVGYRFPGYMKSLNVEGYHFHFIDKTRKLGGHVLSLETGPAHALIDSLSRFKMVLPEDEAFSSLHLDKAQDQDLKKIEKGS
ncbi:MAG: acetolactate decarboxylase [Endozoicomonas sp.]